MRISQKISELVYVLLRVAVYIRRQDLKQRIEKWSLELLENIAFKDFEKALKTLIVLEEFVKFGQLVYEIEPVNSGSILRELQLLDSAIRQIAGLEELPDIKSMFSKDYDADSGESNEYQTAGEGDFNGVKSAIRQSAILERIRQSPGGYCRIKDLMTFLPDVSERTLRYDLQRLVVQGSISKVGSTGPGAGYLAR